MELLTIAGAGVVGYCSWLTLLDEVGSWRRSRAKAGRRRGKSRDVSPGYSCCLLAVSVSRQ
jgi:hypothetical protein